MHSAPRLLALSAITVVLACGGGGEASLPCDGMCGTMVAKVTLLDATGAEVSCASAGVSDIVLTISLDGGAVVGTRTAACGTATELGPINLATYTVRALARGQDGVGLGEYQRNSALVRAGDRNDVEIQIVPGPPSKLGQACSGACPDGYACTQVDFGGTTTTFCSQECGAGSQTQPPANGDLACRQGWTGAGVPRCQLVQDASGATVPWSCLIGCSGDGSCPSGMTCHKPAGGTAVCINP
jgi:hypothetical protein